MLGQCGPGEEGTEIQIDFDITESMVSSMYPANANPVHAGDPKTQKHHNALLSISSDFFSHSAQRLICPV